MTKLTKFCKKCSTEKSVNDFYKCKTACDGLQGKCKLCNKAHYDENKDKLIARQKAFYEANPDVYQAIQQRHAEKKKANKDPNKFTRWCGEGQPEFRTCICCKKTKDNTEENFVVQRGITRNLCRPCNTEKRKITGNENHEYVRKLRIRKNNYRKKELANPLTAMKLRIRKRYLKAISEKNLTKTLKTSEVIGCTWEYFFTHIENQFTDGMTWENRDLWHIDHIIPLATAITIEDVMRLNHYSNLRPLWAQENLKKGAKNLFPNHQIQDNIFALSA